MDNNLNETEINVDQNSIVQVDIANDSSIDVGVSAERSVIRGVDGFSPIAKVTQEADGAKITITDIDGTTTTSVKNGKDGKNGLPGTPGTPGAPGADGFSPIANVSQNGGVTTISITDKVGTTTSSITIPTKTSDLTNDGANNTSTYVEASSLATVATSGSYPDLHNRPTIGNGKITIQRNSTEVDNFTVNQTGNKSINISVPTKTSELTNDGANNTSTYVEASSLATVATSGSYSDLTNKPTIPSAQVNSDWDASSGVAQILNKPSLATVATSGSYSDLTNKPTIPSAQVNSDWNANSGVAEILNKPTIPTLPTLTDLTSSIGTGTSVSIDTGGKVMSYDNIVVVNMDITTSASINAYGVLINGMPTRNPNNFLWLSITDGNNANKTYRVYYENGVIKTRDALPAGTYGINFVYIKA